MLVVRTAEDRTDALGQLVGREQPLRLDHLALAVRTHLGSMRFSHGLFMGNRQLMILTPRPLLLTSLLWEAIHSRTSLEMCHEALSQINAQTFLPAASSFWQHHPKNRVVTLLTGRPSTKRNHICSSSGTKSP